MKSSEDRASPTAVVVQRRRGRPQRLPYDATPSDRPDIDGARRMGWLVATTRLLSPSTAQMGRAEFIARMRDNGIVLDAPRLSRWESGALPASPRLLAAYEAVVGLPAGALLAAHLMVRRTTDPSGTGTEGATLVTDDRLDEVFEQIEGGRATGADWLALATEVMRFERVSLHPGSWSTLCYQLVNELTRSGGVAFLRRYEAAALLMRHSAARRHLTRSLGTFVLHPDVQNATPALALLGEVGDQAAGELVLRLTGERNLLLRRGAIGVLASMAARGQLPTDSDRMVESLTETELRQSSLSRRIAAYELATYLPDAGFDRVISALPDVRARKHVTFIRHGMELEPTRLARIIAEGIATYAEAMMQRAAHDPDLMLRKLVREGLFHAKRERRHLAASLLGVSPYGRPVADALLRLTTDSNEAVAASCWSMLRRMSLVLDRSQLASAAHEPRAGVQARGLITLGLGHGPITDETADQLLVTATSSDRHTLRQTATFALGMAGHQHLVRLSSSDCKEASKAARWWIETGSSLHDTA